MRSEGEVSTVILDKLATNEVVERSHLLELIGDRHTVNDILYRLRKVGLIESDRVRVCNVLLQCIKGKRKCKQFKYVVRAVNEYVNVFAYERNLDYLREASKETLIAVIDMLLTYCKLLLSLEANDMLVKSITVIERSVSDFAKHSAAGKVVTQLLREVRGLRKLPSINELIERYVQKINDKSVRSIARTFMAKTITYYILSHIL